MDEADGNAIPLGTALLMHHAGCISRHDIFRTCVMMVRHLVQSHTGGDGFFRHGIGAAKATALIWASWCSKRNTLHGREKGLGFGEKRFAQLGHAGCPQGTERRTAVMQPDLMRKFRPREFTHLQNIMNELDKLIRVLPHMPDVIRLLDRIKIVPNMMDAAP